MEVHIQQILLITLSQAIKIAILLAMYPYHFRVVLGSLAADLLHPFLMQEPMVTHLGT